MKKQRLNTLVCLMVLALLTNACQPLLEAPLEMQIPGLVHTLAVQTMAADQALRPLLNTPTQAPTQALPSPTPTFPPGTATAMAKPTFTPLPSLTPLGGVPDFSQAPELAAESRPHSSNQPKPDDPILGYPSSGQPANAKPVSDPGVGENPAVSQPAGALPAAEETSTSQLPEGAPASAANPDDPNPRDQEGKLCNQMQFIQDITIPDETPVDPGEEFTKIWQVKNIGTCTWTQDYSLITVWGDDMGTRPPVPFGQVVQPGEVAEISIDMKAPYLPACYFTYWMMTDAKGNRFGTGSIARGNIWVSVSVTIPFLEKYVRMG